jgi:crotonobetainyl-CoA:carnitine CoA-transferase CaiB-like acyl-CoA transferase
VLTVEETVTHPHFIARGTVRTIRDPVAGEFQIPGMPIKTSDYAANLPYVAPRLGEHNAEVLGGLLGKSQDALAALVAAGVLQAGDA